MPGGGGEHPRHRAAADRRAGGARARRRLREGLRLRAARPPAAHLPARARLPAAHGGDGRRPLPVRRGRACPHREPDRPAPADRDRRAAPDQGPPDEARGPSARARVHAGDRGERRRRDGLGEHLDDAAPRRWRWRRRVGAGVAGQGVGGCRTRCWRRARSGACPAISDAATPPSRAIATRSTCTPSARSCSASPGRSRTACGPRHAAWPRWRAACPTPWRSTVRFRQPIVLPAKVQFASSLSQESAGAEPSEIRFALSDAKKGTPHLDGSREARRADRKEQGEVNAQKSVAQRSMGLGLKALGALAGSPALDQLGVRKHAEQLVYGATKNGFKRRDRRQPQLQDRQQAARTRAAGSRRKHPRCSTSPPTTSSRCSRRRCGTSPQEKVRPAASQADADAATPAGAARPGERARRQHARHPRGAWRRDAAAGRGHRGADRRGARPRRHGHRLRGACPGRGGDRDRPLGRSPSSRRPTCRPSPARAAPAAALAMLEPRPLFDPLQLETKARREGGDWVLDGAKSLLARAGSCELFVIAAEARGDGPGAVRGRVLDERALGRGRAGDGPAAGRHRPAADRGRAGARERDPRRGRPRGLRRVRAARADRLVRAGARQRRRRCSTT